MKEKVGKRERECKGDREKETKRERGTIIITFISAV